MTTKTKETVAAMVCLHIGDENHIDVQDFWRTARGLRVEYTISTLSDQVELTCTIPMTAAGADVMMAMAADA